MLLHPNSKTNATILKDVIQQLKKQGYAFGTLDRLSKEKEQR
jgi:peptidoglycan/xylan/chitin deacetylase (PgdA/CDA1 family)